MNRMIYLNEENNGACYMAYSDKSAVVFDPGMAYYAARTIENIKKVLGNRPVDAVFLTHSHYDHVAAMPYIRQCWPNARVYAADYAKKVLVKPIVRETIMKLSGDAAEVNEGKIMEPYPVDLLCVDETLEDGDEVKIGNIRIRAIETIGHTRCSLSYLIDDKILLASETLGVMHEDGEYMPQFLIDYGRALESVRRCRRLGAEQLWLPHHGLAGRPDDKLWQWFEKGIVNAKEIILGILKAYASPEERMEAMARRFWQPKRKGELPRSAFDLNAQAMLKTIEREFLITNQEGMKVEVKNALEQLSLLQKKLYAYQYASSALYLDSVTVAPKDTSAGRGVALGILAGECQKLMTAPEVGEMLHFLSEHMDELSAVEKRQVEVLGRDYEKMSRIPADEYMEYAMLTNEASDVWHKAKETSDFELFAPVLEKLIAFNRKFAGYYDSTKKPYDALLDEYERGVDMAYLDGFFGTIREKLVPLIKAIGEKPQVDDSFLHVNYPVEAQRKFSDYLMEVLKLDRGHCTIGETEHPFTLEFNNQDVRITTNYKENNVVDSMYSVIHEGGHAKYELGISDELQYTCLTGGVSMGVHESQSRFYENIIGRSRQFVEAIFPKMQEFFPEQLKNVTAEQMYHAVNKVEPSLIRTEAEEMTYSLHVMVRYEIEKQLIDGTLAVKDIPQVWNRLYKEYLGVDVPDDRHGCLQDSHWSGGSFGYFPSYALGSAYGAQMLVNMEADINVWDAVAKGDLSGVSAWLGEKVHHCGKMLEPAEIVKNACGEFDPTAYTDYLTKKYTELYQL